MGTSRTIKEGTGLAQWVSSESLYKNKILLKLAVCGGKKMGQSRATSFKKIEYCL